jgi:hypothetical protein
MTSSDLVSLELAARLATRDTRTIRRWLTSGRLTRHEGTPPARGGPRPVLVSRSELLAYLAQSAVEPRPSRLATPAPSVTPGRALPDPARPADPSPLAAELEVVRLRGELEAARLAGRIAELEARLGATLDLVTRVEGQLAEARLDLQAAADRATRAEAEARALRALGGIPWWRRLLG